MKLGLTGPCSRRAFRAAAAAALGAFATGCTTYLLSPADRTQLQDNTALEAQMWRDEAPDSGVSPGTKRAEAKSIYCADRRILTRSSAQDDAGALPCGAGK